MAPGSRAGRFALDLGEPPWGERIRVFVRENRAINYANFVDVLARLYGSRTAFALDHRIEYPGFSGDIVSYTDVLRLVNRMGHALRALGVRRGDRVAMITVNRIEMAFMAFAAGKIGAIPVPMNFMLRPSEIDYIVQKSGAEVLVCDRLIYANTITGTASVPSVKTWAMIADPDEDVPAACASIRALMEDAPDELEPVVPASDDDMALLFFTSGTTGFPKGAMLSHASAMVGVRFHGRVFALKPRIGRHLSLLVMPVAHSGGYTAMLLQMANGMPAYFVSRFEPRLILDLIEDLGVTMVSGTPAMYRMLLDAGAARRDLTSVRIWAGGADAFDDPLIRTFRGLASRKRFGLTLKPMFVRGYGMAEANSYVSTTLWFESGDNCLGWVMPPVRFRIVDEEGRDVPRGQTGELLLAGPTMMSGYWNDPEATAAALRRGWFHTGDLARQGKWRMLYFAGRTGEIIKSGGYKISAAEVDLVVGSHPDVETAATVGMPDPLKGERPVTAVKLRPSAAAAPEEILAWTRERLAPYKCPREIRIVSQMPLTISLKVKRREVLEQLLEQERGTRRSGT